MIYHSHLIINITYKKLNNDDIVTVQLTALYGVIKYKIQLPSLDFINKIDSFILNLKLRYKRRREKKKKKLIIKKSKTIDYLFHTLENLNKRYRYHIKLSKYMIKKVYIKNFLLKIEYGIEDAYIAAICHGLFYILMTNFIIFMQQNMNLQVKAIALKPVFDKEILNLEFNCIIDIKIGHIITALKMLIKTSRGSEIDGTTHRRSYENNSREY